MAKLLNKAPAEYQAEKERFQQELKLFHDGKGTPYRHLPTIDGLEIDLYKLYWVVTASGGWEKVNSRVGWEEIVTLFELPESTANAALALKHTYLRFLDAYEKLHFLGEEEDGDDHWYNDEEDSRTRRQKVQKITSSVPLSYNHQQHQVPDDHREMYSLSTNVYRKTDYDRLILSLCSPLPNEQDFAINVCTLLSNEGRHTLKLVKCPRLLDLLLAHAGVFNHENLTTYLNELYRSTRRYDLLSFWRNACKDSLVRDLMLQVASGALSKLKQVKGRHPFEDDQVEEESLAPTSENQLALLKQRVEDELSEESDIFASGTGLGTKEMAGQRILQIATIIRNLSFEEDNASILAKNLTCLRFCLLCCSSSWSNLNQTGFDIIGNIASEISLEPNDESCCTETLLSTLTQCISSPDRFQVISSLDILCKLCQQDANEYFVEHVLVAQQFVFDQLVMYLSLHDIHLLISTIECLYSLSCLGESACNAIVRTHGALDALVSLVTVEAQSYGPKACILMRVVETVPGTSATQQLQQQQQQQQQQAQSQSPVQVQSASANSPQQTLAQMKPVITTTATAQVIVSAPSSTSTAVQLSQPPLPQQPVPTRLVGQTPQILSSQIRGQVVQVQRPGQPNQPMLQLPRHPVPIRAATSTGQPSQGVRPAVTVTSIGQTQKLQTAQVIQLQSGQILRTQQPQIVQQALLSQNSSPVQLRPLGQAQPVQLQQQPAKPFQQPGQTPAPQQQPTQSSQQVQLRVSNDESHRTFCLSWLRATYEAAPGSRIQHEIMYKQYLASLHKLGRREVISAQLYAACVRTLFGGTVGPNKRQLANGAFDHFFEGVKVRPQPLALRIPAGQNSTVLAKNGTHVMNQGLQPNQATSQAQVINQQQIASLPAPAVPVVLNSAHMPVSVGGQMNAKIVVQQQQVQQQQQQQQQQMQQLQPQQQQVQQQHLQQQQQQVQHLQPQQQQVQQQQHLQQQKTQQTTQNASMPTTAQQQPGSPILTNLLHRGSPGPPEANNQNVNAVNHMESQANVVRQVLQSVTSAPLENNGMSVLDGILPKETKFGKLEESNVAIQGHCKMGNGMLANLLDKKAGESEPPLANGISSQEVRTTVEGNGLGLVAQVDAHKMNGDVDVLLKSLKRPATSGLEHAAPPAKAALIHSNGMILNGPMEVSVNGGESLVSLSSTTYTPGAVVNKQSVILNRAQKLVSLPSLGSNPVATAVNKDSSNQILTPPTSKTLIILQPQNKNTVVSGGTSNGPLSISSMPVVNGQAYQNGSSSITSSVVNPGRSAPLPTEPQIIQLPQTPSSQTIVPGGGSVASEATNHAPGVNSVSSSSATPSILAPLTSSNSSPSSGTMPSLSSLSSVPNPVSSNSLSNTNAANANSSSSSTATTTSSSSSSSSTTSTITSVPKVNPQSPFLCEWKGCLTAFKTAKEVEIHAIKVHCAENDGDMSCLWARCDGMKRKRFSLMTHIQDRHCHPQLMKLMAVRRVQIANTGKSDVPLPPTPPAHPGYPPNAALHAIKRHAAEFVAPKAQAMTDEKEGPVTKSIRLTSALILKNLVIYSSLGKSRLKSYESHLSTVALSNVESSRTISQILFEMTESDQKGS
ncbi:AT-rich interactive domain-containing protein 2-like [Tigriopus californicus]|uniref:AT-rich interactive domain-containing protein 2-like n=1 Tax=Tigriopus californicus TaxID=6832 RepID=UPI0027D9F0EF|nr:AT-rich interactive domain-containing protein 2-like [Tigriopus californicus]